MSPVLLPGNKERAAALVAADDLSDDQIAANLGITRRTLTRWRTESTFAHQVEAIRAELREAVLADSIADRQARVAALNDRWLRMRRVMEARASEHANVPGGDTGLLVRQVKLVKIYSTSTDPNEGSDPDAADVLISAKMSQEIAEYSVDASLLRELREHEKQAAQELGQWSEKVDLTANVSVSKLSDAELEARIVELQGGARAAARAARGTTAAPLSH